METDRLRYFCTIVEVGGLTKAAEILGISHSGLSKSISCLQQELGKNLFIPAGRGLELTEDGKKVYKKSKDILQSIKYLVEDTKTSKEKMGSLSIGLGEIFSSTICEEICLTLNHQISFHDSMFGNIELLVLEKQVHFALTLIPYPHQDIDHIYLHTISMGIFFTNPIFHNNLIENIPFVSPFLPIHLNSLNIQSQDGWPLAQERTLQFYATSLNTAINIVDSGKAAIFIPKFLAYSLNKKRTPEFKLQEFQGPMDARNFKNCNKKIYLIKKKNEPESKAMKAIAKIIRKL